MINWEIEVKEAEPELFIPLPDEVIEAMNLKVGDRVRWDDVDGDGSKFVLTKVETYTPEEKKIIEQAKSKLREIDALRKQFEEFNDYNAGIQLFRAETNAIFFEAAKIMLKELYD